MPFFLAPVSPAGEYLFFARTKENARMSPPMSCPQIKTWAFPRHSARHSRADGNPVNIRYYYSFLSIGFALYGEYLLFKKKVRRKPLPLYYMGTLPI